MSHDDQQRRAALPGVHPASAWSLLGYHADHRMTELRAEAERERIAGLARGMRRAGSGPQRIVARPGPIRSALSALSIVARRLAVPRADGYEG